MSTVWIGLRNCNICNDHEREVDGKWERTENKFQEFSLLKNYSILELKGEISKDMILLLSLSPFFFLAALCGLQGSYFSYQDWTRAWQWEHQILTTGPPAGNSPKDMFLIYASSI